MFLFAPFYNFIPCKSDFNIVNILYYLGALNNFGHIRYATQLYIQIPAKTHFKYLQN